MSNNAAMAWCIARNLEQSRSMVMQQKAYRKGVKNGDENVVEVFTEPIDGDGFNLIPKDDERIVNLTNGVYVLTDEMTIDDVTGVFQLHIYLDGYSETVGQDTNANRVVVELTGNGINQSYTFENQYWEGTTGGVNDYYMTSATLNKNYIGITGVYYWDYGAGYYNRNWRFFDNYAKALQAGAYVSSLPFDGV